VQENNPAKQVDRLSRGSGVRCTFKASAVVFDLDGTLVHSGPDLAVATNRMLENLGLDRHDDEVIFQWLGNGAARLVQRALTGDFDGIPEQELFERGYALFMRYYGEKMCVRSAPYPHVERVLGQFKEAGVPMACLTNKPQRFTAPILQSLHLDRYFDVVVAGDTLPVKKPDPRPLRYIVERLGIPVDGGVMVGDSISDIHAAQAAGMPVICVSFGYNQGLDLTEASPDAIIDCFAELPDIIEFV
jgi:phosphoglycolate phosphatase